ncbi:MAG: hypothetical protein AAF517_07065, partial [Planctomycetota bacterium]
DEPPEEPPYEVVIPPRRPKRGGGPEGGGDGEGDPPGGVRKDGEQQPLPPVEDDDQVEITGSGGDTPVTPEEEKQRIRDLENEAQRCVQTLGEQLRRDRRTFLRTLYGWNPNASYQNECLRALFARYNPQITALCDQIKENNAADQEFYEQKAAARRELPIAVQAVLAPNWWEQMALRGGPWQEKGEPCFELMAVRTIPAAFGVWATRPDLRKKFNEKLIGQMSNGGKTYDQAVAAVLQCKDIYPAGIKPGRMDFQNMWKIHAACMKRTYRKMFDCWLKFVFPDSTEEERERTIDALFRGEKTLSASDRQALEGFRQRCQELDSARAEETSTNESLRAQKRTLIDAFRAEALRDCFPQMMKNLLEKLSLRMLIESYFAWCENPQSPEAAVRRPADLPRHEWCQFLQRLLQDPNLPDSLKAFIQRFLQPGGPCFQPGRAG